MLVWRDLRDRQDVGGGNRWPVAAVKSDSHKRYNAREARPSTWIRTKPLGLERRARGGDARTDEIAFGRVGPGVAPRMTNLHYPNLSLVTETTQAKAEAVAAEIEELQAESRLATALGNAVRARLEDLVVQSLSWGNKIVFPRRLVEQVSAGKRTANVLFLCSRPIYSGGHHFVVNAQINGVRVRDATPSLLKDGTGRAAVVSRPDPKGGLHRIGVKRLNSTTSCRAPRACSVFGRSAWSEFDFRDRCVPRRSRGLKEGHEA